MLNYDAIFHCTSSINASAPRRCVLLEWSGTDSSLDHAPSVVTWGEWEATRSSGCSIWHWQPKQIAASISTSVRDHGANARRSSFGQRRIRGSIGFMVCGFQPSTCTVVRFALSGRLLCCNLLSSKARLLFLVLGIEVEVCSTHVVVTHLFIESFIHFLSCFWSRKRRFPGSANLPADAAYWAEQEALHAAASAQALAGSPDSSLSSHSSNTHTPRLTNMLDGPPTNRRGGVAPSQQQQQQQQQQQPSSPSARGPPPPPMPPQSMQGARVGPAAPSRFSQPAARGITGSTGSSYGYGPPNSNGYGPGSSNSANSYGSPGGSNSANSYGSPASNGNVASAYAPPSSNSYGPGSSNNGANSYSSAASSNSANNCSPPPGSHSAGGSSVTSSSTTSSSGSSGGDRFTEAARAKAEAAADLQALQQLDGRYQYLCLLGGVRYLVFLLPQSCFLPWCLNTLCSTISFEQVRPRGERALVPDDSSARHSSRHPQRRPPLTYRRKQWRRRRRQQQQWERGASERRSSGRPRSRGGNGGGD